MDKMEKLELATDGSSMDIVQDNIAKLKQLFPDVFSEGKIDFEKLQETLGEYTEDKEERYNFSWHGKTQAKRIAQTVSTGTLRPCKEESKHWESSQNLFIEGDNLEVLKLLQKSYHNKVKMIYIDPPYNTGKEFIYPDNYRDNLDTYLEYTGQKDNEGRKFGTNADTSGRYHTNWLNMMYPRLKLARNLLRDDGVIFISIDDNEVTNLRKLCDELFGEEHFLAQFIWKSRQNKDNRSVNGASIDHEYVLCYGRNIRGSERNLSGYANPDSDPKGEWTSANMVGLATADRRPNLHYDLINPDTGHNYGCPKMGWRYDKSTMARLINERLIIWPNSPGGRPRRKAYLSDLSSEYTGFSSIIGNDIYTRNGTADMDSLFSERIMDFPKPKDLIKEVIIQAECCKEIVLDFFSGSSTTAHAVMDLNAHDSGNRKFIMVQLPESCDEKSEAYKAGYKTIADIGKERIRRAGERILQDNADKEGIDQLDIGFKVYKLDSSNIRPWDADFDNLEDTLLEHVDNIKDDRSEDDVLYEILLKYGLDLTVPIEERKISGKTVYAIGLGALVVCLDDDITLDVVDGIGQLKAELEPGIMRVVFKDNGFKDDVVKTNAIQNLKKFGIDDVKSL